MYIEEIHRQGGRTWAYVQSIGSDYPSINEPGIYKLVDSNNSHVVHGNKLYCYFFNEHLAKYQLKIWMPAVKKLKFDGIHWDSLGSRANNYQAETAGLKEFLKTSYDVLKEEGLLQTFNFVDNAWLKEDVNYFKKYVTFLYTEVWNENEFQRSRSYNYQTVIPYYTDNFLRRIKKFVRNKKCQRFEKD